MQDLVEALADFNKLLKQFENMDPHTERLSLMFTRQHLVTRKSMMKRKKEQTTTDIFLKRVTPPQEEPHMGPSGGGSEA